jgi:hypothetical protein
MFSPSFRQCVRQVFANVFANVFAVINDLPAMLGVLSRGHVATNGDTHGTHECLRHVRAVRMY